MVTYEAWRDDRTIRLGAGLAYYSVFALAPMVVVAVAIAGAVFGEDAAQGLVVERTEETLGTEAAQLLQDLLVFVESPRVGASASVAGVLVLAFSASVLFLALQDALNTIWEVPPRTGWKATIKRRLIAFVIVLSFGLLLLAALVIQVLVTLLEDLPFDLDAIRELMQFIGGLVPIIAIGLVLALAFKYVPNAESPWRVTLAGGAVTAVVASAGNQLFGLYLGNQSPVTMGGAASSLVLALLWVYYQAQIVLAGAHLTKALRDRRMNESEAHA